MGRREGDAEQRRAAILAAAEAEFIAHGYAGASIRAIAKRAEVSSALLYWFFESKAKLFAAVLSRRIDDPAALAFPPEALAIPPLVFLTGVAHIYTNAVSQPEQIRLIRLMLRESEREPELTKALGEIIVSRALGPLRNYFSHHMAIGNLRRVDPDYAAQAFIGIFVAYVLRRYLLQEPLSQSMDTEEYVDVGVNIFLQGILTEGGAKAELPSLEAIAGIIASQPKTPRPKRKIEIEE